MNPTILEAPVTMLLAAGYLVFAMLGNGIDPDIERLIELGALSPILVAHGEPWRLLSYSVLHGGLIHLAFNLMGLLSMGPVLERHLGPTRFAGLYLLSALGGGVMVAVTNSAATVVVGGSGSLFGILGSALALHMRAGRHLLEFLETYGGRQLISILVANLALGMMIPVVSNAGHIGGLVAGFALTFHFYEPAPRSDRWTRVTQVAWGLLLVHWTAFCIWWRPPF